MFLNDPHPTNEDGSIMCYDGTQNLVTVHREFKEYCSRVKLGLILMEDERLVPFMPVFAYARRNQGDPPLPDDARTIATYEDAYSKWTVNCDQVRSLYKRVLGVNVTAYLKTTGLLVAESSRENIIAIMSAVAMKFGSWSSAKGEANYKAMTNIPDFTSTLSVIQGLATYADLLEERGTRHQRHQYEDSASRTWLVRRISKWSELTFLAGHIDFLISKDDATTYACCRDMLTAKVDTMISAETASKKVAAEAMHIAMHTSAQHSDNGDIEFQQLTASFVKTTKCFNCGGTGHFRNNCSMPYCSQCGQGWASCEAPDYHHNSRCPLYPIPVAESRKGAVSDPPVTLPYRLQQPTHPQYRFQRGRGATSVSGNVGRFNTGQHRAAYQGQSSSRGLNARGAPAVRGRGSAVYPARGVHEASLDQTQGAWVQTQVWMPHAMSNVVQYDPEDQYQQPEDESWMEGQGDDGEM